MYGGPVASNKCFNKSETIVLQVTKRMGSIWLGRFDSLEDCFGQGQEGCGDEGEIAHVEGNVLQILLGAFAQLRELRLNFIVSICPYVCTSAATTQWIFVKFDIWGAFNENQYRNSKFFKNISELLRFGRPCIVV